MYYRLEKFTQGHLKIVIVRIQTPEVFPIIVFTPNHYTRLSPFKCSLTSWAQNSPTTHTEKNWIYLDYMSASSLGCFSPAIYISVFVLDAVLW